MDWINARQGWAVSQRGNGTAARLVVFRTADGGITWDSSKIAPGSFPPTLSPTCLKFANATIGYLAASRGRVYKTEDGGVTWKISLEITPIAPSTIPPSLQSISIVGENIVWVGGSTNGGINTVWRTSDGGTNWTNAWTYNAPTSNAAGLVAYDSLQAFYLRNSGLAHFTANGGKDWNTYSMPGTAILEDGLFMVIDPNCGEPVCQKMWVVGTNGNIMEFGSEKILPLSMSSLTGAITDNGNQLFWSAYEQSGVKYFEVETSADGQKFVTTSDKIEASANFNDAYQWLHTNPPIGANYYRVRATEKSGKQLYTNILRLSNNSDEQWKFFVQNNTLSVFNTAVEKGDINFRVMNVAGQQIATKAVQHPGGAINQTIQLPIGTNGIQILQITQDQQSRSYKVFVGK